jgi:hypothetical protein
LAFLSSQSRLLTGVSKGIVLEEAAVARGLVLADQLPGWMLHCTIKCD